MYSIISSPPLTIQLIPIPAVPGTLEIICVQTPAALDSTSSSDLINIPDDHAHTPKWGALSDLLLRKGLAYDEVRGKYCQFQYDLGIRTAALRPVLVQTTIDGDLRLPSSVQDEDNYNPTWECVLGTPETPLTLGQNILALSPIPDDAYTVICDVMRDAPIPAGLTTYIELGRQDLDVVIGYAQHLAAFKMGGQEFLSTMPLFESFYKRAAKYNRRLVELQDYIKVELQSFVSARPQANPLALGPDSSAGV